MLGSAELLDEAELLAGKVVPADKDNAEGVREDPRVCEELRGFADEGGRTSEFELKDGMLAPDVDKAAILAVCEGLNIRLEWATSIALSSEVARKVLREIGAIGTGLVEEDLTAWLLVLLELLELLV